MTDLWFVIIRVRNLLPVIPVLWLFGFRVFNFFGRQEVPVILQIAGLDLLIVNLNLISVVWVDNQCVQVGVLVILQGMNEMLAGSLIVFYSAVIYMQCNTFNMSVLAWFNAEENNSNVMKC